MKSKLIDPPRQIRIPNALRTRDPNEKFGEIVLFAAVVMLSALVVAMAVSGLFR